MDELYLYHKHPLKFRSSQIQSTQIRPPQITQGTSRRIDKSNSIVLNCLCSTIFCKAILCKCCGIIVIVAITANGHELVIDHCIFYKCKCTVVFCDAKGGTSKKNAMTYCIVNGNYTSGLWTYGTDEDFEFHHNIITRCLYTWMRGRGNQRKYKVNDCVLTDNKYHSGYGLKTGEYTQTGRYIQTGPEITYEEKNVIKDGKVVLEKGHMRRNEALEIPRNYLHPLPGTLGSNLGAGFFKKRPNILGKDTVLDER